MAAFYARKRAQVEFKWARTVREKARRRSGLRKVAQKWQTCASATAAPRSSRGGGGARGVSSGSLGPPPPAGLEGGEEELVMAISSRSKGGLRLKSARAAESIVKPSQTEGGERPDVSADGASRSFFGVLRTVYRTSNGVLRTNNRLRNGCATVLAKSK